MRSLADLIERVLGEIDCPELDLAYCQAVAAALRAGQPGAVVDVYLTPSKLGPSEFRVALEFEGARVMRNIQL